MGAIAGVGDFFCKECCIHTLRLNIFTSTMLELKPGKGRYCGIKEKHEDLSCSQKLDFR